MLNVVAPKTHCELCSKKLTGGADSICGPCDAEMIRTQAAEKAQLDAAWAGKFRCKRCAKGLTRNRARLCEVCQPPDSVSDDLPSTWTLSTLDVGSRRIGRSA